MYFGGIGNGRTMGAAGQVCLSFARGADRSCFLSQSPYIKNVCSPCHEVAMRGRSLTRITVEISLAYGT